MKTTALRRSAAPIALAAALLAAFLVLFSPVSASAHDALVSSSPAADETVETLPSALTLTFSAKLIDGEGATEVVVTDPSGATVTDGTASVEGAIVTQPLTGSGPAGEYSVIWKVVSSDGHPTSGEFSFTVSTGNETASPEPTASPTSAVPSPEQSATSETTTSPAPETDADAGSAWIWVLAIIGVLVIAGVVVWLLVRKRGDASPSDSDDPSER